MYIHEKEKLIIDIQALKIASEVIDMLETKLIDRSDDFKMAFIFKHLDCLEKAVKLARENFIEWRSEWDRMKH